MTDQTPIITDKIDSLIDKFREEYYEETMRPFLGFGSPCQIEVFPVKDPLNVCIIVLSHDKNRPDREIIVNEPTSRQEFFDSLDKTLEKPRWKQVLGEEHIFPSKIDQATKTKREASSRRDLLVDALQSHFQTSASEILFSDIEGLYGSHRLTERMWCSFIYGDIENLDVAEFFVFAPPEDEVEEDSSEEVSEADKDAEANLEVESDETDVKGLGTYFHNPVWVGEVPDPELKERIQGKLDYERETVVSRTFGEYSVSVTQDGLVSVSEEEDKRKALTVLNTVFGAAIFHGYQFHAATQNDLLEVTLDEDGIESIMGSPNLPRKVATIKPGTWRGRNNPSISVERERIDINEMESILDDAKEIYLEEEISERIHFALQAFTHHENGEFAQAFLLSWIAIEQHINSYLNEHLRDSLNVNSDRRDKITDSANWTSTHKIEILEIADGISDTEYDMIDKLRSKRNKVVHEMASVDESESKEIIEFSFYIGIFDRRTKWPQKLT